MLNKKTNTTAPSVTIVIPTTCDGARREAIARAIGSVLAQEGVDVRLLLVVNGIQFDPHMLEELRGNSRFSTIQLPEPDLPAARASGRRAVRTEYFGFLDDDDELLPGALGRRCAAMVEQPSVDFVVTNGYRGAAEAPHLRRTERIATDPVVALLEQNWLASCAGLFRSSSCDQHFFDEMPAYLEWTALAFRLLHAGKRVAYIDECTYRINDSPISLSKSTSYRAATAQILADLLRLETPQPVRRRLRQMLTAARHDLSVASLQQGKRLQAWKYHLQSLTGSGGLRYLSYTRHMFS